MIIQLRKKFKSMLFQILVWAVVALMVLPLSITQIVSFFTSGSSWVISVNGIGISRSEITATTAQFEDRIKQLEQQYPQFASMYLQLMGLNQDPKQLAVDALVRQALIHQAAQTLGLPVSEKSVKKQFEAVDPRLLRAQLMKVGMSMAEFEVQVARDIASGMVESLVKQSAYVPDFMMKDYYRGNFLGKKFSIVPFKLSDFVAKQSTKQVSQEALQAFFADQNARYKRYQTPEKRTGYVWKFDPSSFGISITQDEIDRYYQANKVQFKDKPAQIQVRRIVLPFDSNNQEGVLKQAQELRETIKQDAAQFEAKAKSFAQNDKEYGAQAGLMPLFAAGSHDREFEKAAFTLQNNGDVSAPVVTKDAVMLLQRVDKKQPTYTSIQVVANDIKNVLTQQKFNAQFTGQARQVIEESKKNPAALEAFIASKNGKKQTITNAVANQTTESKTLFRMQPQTTTALQEGDLGTIVQLTAVEKAAIPSFESVAQTVAKDYAQDQANSALKEALKKAKEDAKGLSEQAFNALFTGRVDHTQLIKPSDDKAIAKLKERGISMFELFQLENLGDVAISYAGQDGFIVRLDALEPFNEQEFATNKPEFKASIEREEEQNVFMGFVASLYRNATIKQK